jgi:hypothetical protein
MDFLVPGCVYFSTDGKWDEKWLESPAFGKDPKAGRLRTQSFHWEKRCNCGARLDTPKLANTAISSGQILLATFGY